jgi:hypothetical protein
MGLFDFFRSSASLTIADCLNRTITSVSNFPATLNGKTANGATTPLCRISKSKGEYYIDSLNPNSLPLLDGEPIDHRNKIARDRPYALSLRGHLLIISISSKSPDLGKDFDAHDWSVEAVNGDRLRLQLRPEELNQAALLNRFSPTSQYVVLPGSSEVRFPLKELINLLPKEGAADEAPSSHPPIGYGRDAATVAPNNGEPTCPICWKTFSKGDVLNIAAHDDLTGDPELGPHAKKRFVASRFNELGQALDERGVVSLELACPHCRGRLPSSFLSQNHLIFSLVGAPSSGKSYYLSTLLQLLPVELMRHFGCILQDGDPSGNVRLNEMKNRLFSAMTPEDAFISKTDFEGLMYEQLPRNGKTVALPRPFVYHLRKSGDPRRRVALVFYDNAGEHFKPTISLDDSPGALHVAASSVLFFLYDPTANRAFRKRLRRKRDPQLRSQATDEQDTILAEMGIRVKKLKAKDSHELVDTPIAVIVGKCDVWKSILPEDSLSLPEDRPITEEEMERNSESTRNLLLEYCPTIVANADSISTRVRYFPVSSFGHSPKEIEDGPLVGKLAPNPQRLKPILATAPTLWALSLTAANVLSPPTSNPQSII